MSNLRRYRKQLIGLLLFGLVLAGIGLLIQNNSILLTGIVFLWSVPIYNGLHGMTNKEFYWVWGLYMERALHHKQNDFFKGRDAIMYGTIEFAGGLLGLMLTAYSLIN